MQAYLDFFTSHSYLTSALVGVLILLLIVEFLRYQRRGDQIDPAGAVRLMNHENAVVIDVRSIDHFKKGHIINAQSLPAANLAKERFKLEKIKTKPLIIVCQLGMECQKVATTLRKEGYNAVPLKGGMRAWQDAQLPIIKETS